MLDDENTREAEGKSEMERKSREDHVESFREKVEKRGSLLATMAVAYLVLFLIFGVVYFVLFGYFEFSSETVKTLNESINNTVSLLPAMIFGVIGALGKLSLTGGELRSNLAGVIGSGVIAVVAVLSFKSGLISIVANAYFSGRSVEVQTVAHTGGEYANILIALISGMFAYNIFSLMKQAAEAAKLKRD